MKSYRGHLSDTRSFWNSRARLGKYAGTRDFLAKQLEMDAIISFVQDHMKILDLGCGNGLTAMEIARHFAVDILGIDFAEEMVESARTLAAEEELKGTVAFQKGDLTDLSQLSGKWHLIYTERTIINLSHWPTQRKAISDVCDLLVDGGLYVMCENSQDGLDMINALRERVGLPTITPPWHNRYLRDEELQQLQIPGVRLEKVIDYSSTYYFLSRVVNAWVAKRQGKEPDYEAEVNQLALELPSIGDMGQGKIWLWRKIQSHSGRSARQTA